MTVAPETREGWLWQGQEKMPVRLAYASPVSLYVQFVNHPGVPQQTGFDRLVITAGEESLELTRCRLNVEDTHVGFAGRLVFLDDVYDFKRFFVDGMLTNLRSCFEKLPVIVGQRAHVRPEFREYASNLVYDLASYKRLFNEQDRILMNEPAHVREAAQDAMVRMEGPRFFAFLDQGLEELARLVHAFTREEHERHGYFFRRQIWEFLMGSAFLQRTNLKPRGYAGDSEMMRMLYENRPVGTHVFNQLLHKHPVESQAAQAVRNRRVLIPTVIEQVKKQVGPLGPGGFRFMSVACGPAWELQDLFRTTEDFSQYRCTLLDQDDHALGEARAGIERIETVRNVKIQATYLNESVRTMLKNPALVQQWGRFHFLYSMGLFDYLTPPVATAVLAKFYELLEPGGTMLIGNYHVGNATRLYMDYWMDWTLCYRTEEDMRDLAAALPGAETSVFFEDTRAQMFLQVRKAT